VIPNDKPDYDTYKKMCMAIYAATGGSDEGRDMFESWAERWTCGENDPAANDEAWRQCQSSPPTKIGVGSIFHWAKEADPGWYARFKSGLTEEAKRDRAPRGTAVGPIRPTTERGRRTSWHSVEHS
jgi:hypothetical protein